ncbi:hypothetical protein PK69_21545 [Xanthomonas phaseoli pv. phaseoli]|uniref:Uncharacterized protein n=1 Tax=Xanthomonas campestris pv. phaseoli TaxID=317013 RepID=A0AB38E7N4_XANCH|nr:MULTISPECIES: hypothetical protein [Xanthomonas]ATS24095.1 hypothetical protein XppCFBP412P_22585 [Xanthomonas phaseoli pv. phaseoli]ATS24847.1 hypothetical protein XppCFBP6164P_03940 [Xanthomonas phaseoli pv. phaseoli]ATS31808.1 hypothetical protein XppCFBP6546P_20910 [Xanthomonas phaseoli pv. phaseoli]ATS36564.1 hypothetical protein XppCFBP6982P_22665 [Xanthomonas phaseoli pv. phaseoli]AZU13997.1 hypothetical protein AC609_15140 [Xanthomonas phaseoli pv. phaseoli]
MNLYSVLVYLTAACILVSVVNLIVSRHAVTLGLVTPVQYRIRAATIVVVLLTLFMGLWWLKT